MKRSIDILVSIIAITLLLPLLILVCIVLAINIGTPVFFLQQRPGLNSNPFTMVKFRTMQNTVDLNGILLPDEQRLTTIGKFLRKTSLDELPELWNVLKGEMSLVGPRPLLMEYLPLYSNEEIRRHEVRPGITGWAQINGRNAISWDEKFKFDIWYVENQSIWLDIKILILTVKKVFMTDGISADDHVTMERFSGNDK